MDRSFRGCYSFYFIIIAVMNWKNNATAIFSMGTHFITLLFSDNFEYPYCPLGPAAVILRIRMQPISIFLTDNDIYNSSVQRAN